MKRKLVIKNPRTNEFYTGRYWDIPWSMDIKDAHKYHLEGDVERFMAEVFSEENDPFEGIPVLEVVVIWVKS